MLGYEGDDAVVKMAPQAKEVFEEMEAYYLKLMDAAESLAGDRLAAHIGKYPGMLGRVV